MLNSHKIMIKTEASEQIGLGHIRRMMTLGQYLNENKNNGVIYAINKDEIAKTSLEEKGYLYDYEYAESEEELIKIIKKHKPDILIIDVQKLDSNTNYNFKNIKEQAGINKIILVDKYVENDSVDLMIIQGIQDHKFEEKFKHNSKVIFGLDCVFINTEFAKAKKKEIQVPY
ncbi:MAG: hypothetical protein AB1796_05030 [Bacillota bacterium]